MTIFGVYIKDSKRIIGFKSTYIFKDNTKSVDYCIFEAGNFIKKYYKTNFKTSHKVYIRYGENTSHADTPITFEPVVNHSYHTAIANRWIKFDVIRYKYLKKIVSRPNVWGDFDFNYDKIDYNTFKKTI